MTEKYRKLKWAFFAASLACSVVPVIVFFIIGLANGDISISKKLTLSLGFCFTIGVSVVGLIRKHHYRCGIWVFILVCYIAIKNFAPILLTFGICCCLDELIFTPMYRKYRELVVVNAEIDKRMPVSE